MACRTSPGRSFFLLAALGAGACSGTETQAPAPRPGDPIHGISEAERGRFLLGKAVFERLTTPEEGLGPLFNETRCSACHDQPASGGSGGPLVTKATRFVDGSCDLLADQGGDNIQRRTTPLLAAHGIESEEVPSAATAQVSVTGPSLFGLGLVDAIPETGILAYADAADADGDGVSGRAVRVPDGRLGRFGRKNEVASLLEFVETALRFELGLTTPPNPVEETVNGALLPDGSDPIPDPEIDGRGLEILTDYIRFLAPPAPETPTNPATRDSLEAGERIFGEIGCGTCHVPSMTTGPAGTEALKGKTVALYSDLLLHDMGPEMADVCGPGASPSEYRTARLWGLRHRSALLHDGRAPTPLEAISHHGGEAQGARSAFSALPEDQQALLLRFLSSL